MCGADDSVQITSGFSQGSPPRVRSRRGGQHATGLNAGITSACAEQTDGTVYTMRPLGDHLRVCGADRDIMRIHRLDKGSPPRVRSRRLLPRLARTPCGITSACAEQTVPDSPVVVVPTDHLRVCGADVAKHMSLQYDCGSPPRVRSRHGSAGRAAGCSGITSACAEQTCQPADLAESAGDHLRVCGADKRSTLSTPRKAGSPPRVRSRPVVA